MLLHHPNAWSSRVHLVLYYGLLMVITLAIISFLAPDDPRSESLSSTWVGFVIVISLVALVLWSIFLLRFNVFKRFGLSTAGDRLLSFVLYFISIGVFVFFPFVQPLVETAKANSAYSDEEIFNDINTVNRGIVQLEYDSLDHSWDREYLFVVDSPEIHNVPAVTRDKEYYESNEIRTGSSRTNIYKGSLDLRLAVADSFTKLSDTSYILFSVPDYNFLSPYFSQYDPRSLGSYEIYKELVENFKTPDREALKLALQKIIDKYSIGEGYYYFDQSNEYLFRLNKRYQLGNIQESMGNIMDRKHRFDAENIPSFFRMHFYITLCLTLLMFTFRHSTVKSFFLALLAGIVLTILTSLFMAFTRSTGFTGFLWILFYAMIFFGISVTAIYQRKRSFVTGIAINLFTWLLPFIPLCIVAAYYERLRIRTYYDHYKVDVAERSMAFLTAEILGVVMLVIFLVTYLNKVYKRWYASAEE